MNVAIPRRVRVTSDLSAEAVQRLQASTSLEMLVGEAGLDIDDADIDVLIGPPAAGPESYRRLRWLQVPFAGVERIGLQDWADRGITVTNARGVFAVPIAQYVLAAILAVSEHHRDRAALQSSHRWPANAAKYVGNPVRGLKLALIGYGGIGREIARLAVAHGMRVGAVKARPHLIADHGFRLPGTGDPDGTLPEVIVGPEALREVVRDAAFVVISAALTDSTEGLFGADAIAACPDEAWLINVARGALVDETALMRALDARQLAGAVLDVFDEEPLPPDHWLWRHPLAIVTPHIAGRRSDEVFEALVAENLARWEAGRPLLNVVDPDRGY